MSFSNPHQFYLMANNVLKYRPIPFLFIFFISFSGLLQAQQIEHIEPPFWWRGMHNPELQIMLHGSDIGDYRVHIDHEAVDLVAVHQTKNPNYLFVDVRVNPGHSAATFQIELIKDGNTIFSQPYELRERKPGSAERKGFDQSDVMYLITPDRFANGDPSNDAVGGMKEGLNRAADYGRHGGDIAGIMDHLDYIKEMGFTAIWLNPVLENDQEKWSYHGYATTDYYQVDARFGTNEEYVELSRKAAEMGIKVIMDIIVNHCGSEHWWMEDPPMDDWINFQEEGFVRTNHRKTTLLDPYGAPSDRELMVKGWFVESMPDLNQKNPFMSRYLIQNTIWWIEYADLGGIRQDTYSYPFRDFMTDWTCAIMDEYPHMNIVGEEWFWDTGMLAYWQQGKQNPDGYSSCLRSLMDFPLQVKLVEALNQEEGFEDGITRLYMQLGTDYHYPAPEELVIFPDNHDMSRIWHQLGRDFEHWKMAMAFILTTRGVPQVYYGTEILMDHEKPGDHGTIRSDFPGGWEGDKVNVFSREGLTRQQREAMQYMQRLLTWRKGNRAVQNGSLMHYIPEDGVYVYFRSLDQNHVMVVLNKNVLGQNLDLARFKLNLGGATQGKNILTGEHLHLGSKLHVSGKSVLVIEYSE